MRDFPLKSDQEIDEALIHLPFEIQAKSLQEKISAYERIKLLLDTKVGQELLVEAKKIAEKHGKIILKEDKTDGYGYVDVKNPRTIVLSSRFGKSIEQTDNPKKISSIKHLATSTLAHEMRHVIQHYHPDGKVCLSLEDGAKKNLMQELGARMTNVLYESGVGLDSPRALLFQSFKQKYLDSGMDDEEAEKNARTQMARLYLTGGKDYKGKDSELKEEFSDWKNFLINQSLRYTARRQFSTGNNLHQGQSNYMNYLCDSMGLDRDILKITDQIYDNHRCVCKNGALETIQLGNVICERFQKDGQTIIHETEQSDKSETKCIMIDGQMRQWEKYTTNGSYVIQYNHLGQEVSNQNYPPKAEKFDREGYLKKTKIDLQTNIPQKDNPFTMKDLLKRLQVMVQDVQSLRRQVGEIRFQNPTQKSVKMNALLQTQSQAGKEQIFQNNLANNPTRLSAPER